MGGTEYIRPANVVGEQLENVKLINSKVSLV